ncbi:hypothetical protein [Haliovirga abyssi]|uniref:Uncharacterized protein n=1 Tax=Haliovirga abyssi TaxID=2996794 RepID=A0AAU9DAR5_9FUSO|nr:hypothetical protein [Haliovirga abyssi]BDU50425.1 hypothetical protein HLVA_09940 [Haliovirga abyssi]
MDHQVLILILDNNAKISKHYNKVVKYFTDKKMKVEEITVEYEFQKDENKMLRIKK